MRCALASCALLLLMPAAAANVPPSWQALLENRPIATLREHPVSKITLQRGPCKGPCPAYKVTVDTSGLVTYEGRAHVERKGMHSGRVDEWQFHRIAQFIIHSGFLDLAEAESLAVDAPIVQTTVVLRDGERTITRSAPSTAIVVWTVWELIDKLLYDCEWDSGPPK